MKLFTYGAFFFRYFLELHPMHLQWVSSHHKILDYQGLYWTKILIKDYTGPT